MFFFFVKKGQNPKSDIMVSVWRLNEMKSMKNISPQNVVQDLSLKECIF